MPILQTNPRLETPLPPFFLRTTFRNSTIITASPLIRKSTIPRSTLWCSHYSVAKRQQLWCPLGTATLSLKFENVVPGRWICSFSFCGQLFFYCSSIDEQYSLVRVFYQKSLHDVTFSSSSTTLKHCFFVHISLVFEARLKPIAASVT